jgi:uncharacterized membrane protein
MKRTTWGIAGFSAGAGLMYWADPRSGRRRRARLEELALHAALEARDAGGKAARDVSHRAKGLLFRGAAVVIPHRRADDVVIEERVRSAIGRASLHPGAIEVHCDDGRVVLSGPVLARDHLRVFACARKVKGVREVEDHLQVHQTAGQHPSLQGAERHLGSTFGPFQRNWPPTTRALASVTALGLVGLGLSRRRSFVLSLLGGILGLRAFTNLDLRRLFGLGAGRRAIEFHKDITVLAPVSEVFQFWSAMENFPRFMSHVKDVRWLADGRTHWRVEGPAGMTFQWDSEITQFVREELLAWRSVPGSLIGHSGVIRFEAVPQGTRIDIRLSYNPPAGAVGHAFARLLGVDPKREMDDDLLRLKSILERGSATGREGKVLKDQLAREPLVH